MQLAVQQHAQQNAISSEEARLYRQPKVCRTYIKNVAVRELDDQASAGRVTIWRLRLDDCTQSKSEH